MTTVSRSHVEGVCLGRVDHTSSLEEMSDDGRGGGRVGEYSPVLCGLHSGEAKMVSPKTLPHSVEFSTQW